MINKNGCHERAPDTLKMPKTLELPGDPPPGPLAPPAGVLRRAPGPHPLRASRRDAHRVRFTVCNNS